MAIGLINQAAYAHYGRYASTGYPRPSFPGARFQERASEFVRYMAETFSRHQIDIESEE
ncbi:host-nuclease inhibitor Gam family protein [Salmonella enterica subsp. enterica serovar Minnesota]